MILIYLVCFILLTCGIILLLGLTPETITDDLMRLFVPDQPLRDKVLIAQGRKKSRRITKIILHIREALEATGKSNQFTAACAASLFLMIAGCIATVLIGNYFLIPVFAVAFAALPFFFARNTISAYDRHIREEMETALSIVTTSYIRTDDIVGAVRENIAYLKPPIREIFLGFVGDSMMISSDLKDALRNMREKIDNAIFNAPVWGEWCDTLITCQDDRTLKDTLLPIVSKLTDVRIVNNELKTMSWYFSHPVRLLPCPIFLHLQGGQQPRPPPGHQILLLCHLAQGLRHLAIPPHPDERIQAHPASIRPALCRDSPVPGNAHGGFSGEGPVGGSDGHPRVLHPTDSGPGDGAAFCDGVSEILSGGSRENP